MSDLALRSRVIRMGAEFLVIVVGVLVALAVDEWSSSVQERELEREYLQSLSIDLAEDSAAYAGALAPNLEEALAALRTIVPVARGVEAMPIDTVGFVRLMWESRFSVTQFEERRTTFEELLATGNLNLIRSAELRASIVSYYEQVRMSTSRSERGRSAYAQLLFGYLPAFSGGELDDPATRHRVLADLAQLVRSEEFLREANRHRVWLNFQLSQISRLQGLLSSLQTQLAQAQP